MLSDHGQTQGATFKQRNGYGLDDLVERSLSRGEVDEHMGGDEQDAMVGLAVNEATGRKRDKPAKNDVSGRDVVVLGSGNLGLIYLMEEKRRLTLEEIDERHPELIPALREHPHVGWLLVRSAEHGAVAIGAAGRRTTWPRAGSRAQDPLAPFSPTRPHHLLRTDGFEHVADIMVGSFYDPDLDEGCAFEELISFHGGLGGPQTRPFILHPERLPVPDEPIVGAAAVHGVLTGWRQMLQGAPAAGRSAGPPRSRERDATGSSTSSPRSPSRSVAACSRWAPHSRSSEPPTRRRPPACTSPAACSSTPGGYASVLQALNPPGRDGWRWWAWEPGARRVGERGAAVRRHDRVRREPGGLVHPGAHGQAGEPADLGARHGRLRAVHRLGAPCAVADLQPPLLLEAPRSSTGGSRC